MMKPKLLALATLSVLIKLTIMSLCKLCQEKEATDEFSHILTLGLAKEAVNIEGYKERDYNQTFILQKNETPKLHLGRNIIEKHITGIQGASIVDNQEKSIDPLGQKELLCRECEDAIGYIESEFISTVNAKLKKNTIQNLLTDSKGNKQLSLSAIESNLAYLLSYSLFFRASVTSLNNHFLEKKNRRKNQNNSTFCQKKITNRAKKACFE